MHTRGYTAREHVRADTILLFDKGWAISQIGEALFLNEDSVRKYFSSYDQGKLPALLNDAYKIKPSKLTDYQEDLLKRHVAENLYIYSALIITYVLLEFGVSYSSNGIHTFFALFWLYLQKT